MTLKFCLFLFVAIALINSSASYNILVIFGHPGKSHFDAFQKLFTELADRGHTLTVVGHVRMKEHANIRQIPLRDKEPMLHAMNLQDFDLNRYSYYIGQPKLLAMFADLNCAIDLQHQNFQNFLKEDNKFDLIMTELFNTNCYYGLINKFKAPMIGLSSCTMMPWQSQWFGTSPEPAFVQNIFGGFDEPMSFFSRVENVFLQIYVGFWYTFFMEKPGRELSIKYTGYEPINPKDASLILVNTHHSVTGARPLTPSVIEVGGLHINNRKPQKLPEDIENWINNAEAGVIYFSLGSMIKGNTLPQEKLRAFMRAFAKLPQKVLWKWENDTMPGKPDNVMIAKWMPQFDILSHPNVKLFISHGGLLGTTESIWNGVPIIVMPQFGDQLHNGYAVQNRGAGVVLQLRTATEESISAALSKGLDPQTYKNAKELQDNFRDRPMSPMDTAIYWVEHVARHKGAKHMRSPAVDLPFWKLWLLDVLAFYFVLLITLMYCIYSVMKVIVMTMLRVCAGKKQKTL